MKSKNKQSYRKGTVKGFGADSLKREQEMKARMAFAVAGLVKTFGDDIKVVEWDCLEFVQSADGRNFNNNCEMLRLLEQGRWGDFTRHCDSYTLSEMSLLFDELQQYFAVIRGCSTLEDAWGDVTPYTITNDRDALSFSMQRGLEAIHAELMEMHADRFDAEAALSKAVMDATDWELVDCGMLLNQDGTPATDYRDAVFAKGDTEVALRVFHSPRHVDSDSPIPAEIQTVITQWEVAS